MDTISLHLTSNQLISRVVLHLDGETFTAEVFGDGHQSAARMLATQVGEALRHSKSAALNLIA
jgi:hypothetical protein